MAVIEELVWITLQTMASNCGMPTNNASLEPAWRPLLHADQGETRISQRSYLNREIG